MVPPPIRTTCVSGGSQTSLERSKQPSRGWLGPFRDWMDRNPAKECQAAAELSEEAEDELVCLSPLSQFFCNVGNPPDIYANMTLDGHCTLEQLVPPMQHMADLHDRFRRRLVYSFGAWRAEVLEQFDVRSLMREVTLDGPHTDAQQAYHQYMGKLMSEEPLGTHGLPPWDVVCIHYAADPQRTDVLMRASHIIGDGQLFMKLIKQIMEPLDDTARADYDASITHARAGTPGVSKRTRRRFGDSSSGSASSSSLSSCGGGGAAAGSGCCDDAAAAHAGGMQRRAQQQQQERGSSKLGGKGSQARQQRQQDLVQRGQQRGGQQDKKQQQQQDGAVKETQHQHHHRQGKLEHGMWRSWQLFVGLLHWCWNQYTALIFSAIMLFWYADPVTVIKASEAQCSGPRRWGSVTIGLQDFHRVAKALRQSLNTLAVACLAGGVRRYLLRHGQRPARRIRMCGMVDTRSMPGLLPGSMHGASNNFSFIGVPLYTGDISAQERLARVGRAMSWVRHSLVVPIAIRMPDLIQTIFRHPESSSKAILRALPLKTTVGFSNMKGPAGSWSLSGYRVTKIHNGVQPMAFGSFISLFSYDSTLTFTHTCFETKTKAPEVLLECILEEYQCLRKAASISSTTDGCSGSPSSPGGSQDSKIKAA